MVANLCPRCNGYKASSNSLCWRCACTFNGKMSHIVSVWYDVLDMLAEKSMNK